MVIFVPVQIPAPLHMSPDVHALLSLHGAQLNACLQPEEGSQESSVQGLVSLQSMGVPTHTPPLHESFIVHPLLSSHFVPSKASSGTQMPDDGSHAVCLQSVSEDVSHDITVLGSTSQEHLLLHLREPLQRFPSSNFLQS
jgi:hypothetical protein